MRVGSELVGRIGTGLCLLVGVEEGDGEPDVLAAVDKIINLRVFADEAGKMNRSLLDVGGSVLVVSQFTLLGDIRKGRRPSFTKSAAPGHASALIQQMLDLFAGEGVETAGGRFGAHMGVEIFNDGPVTFVIDVKQGVVF